MQQTGSSYFPVSFEHAAGMDEQRAAGLTFQTVDEYSCVDRFDVKLTSVDRARGWDLELHFDRRSDKVRLHPVQDRLKGHDQAGLARRPGACVIIVGHHRRRPSESESQGNSEEAHTAPGTHVA